MKLSNAFRASAFTALWTFIGMFAVTAIGWLQDVAQWASTSGHTPLPGLSVIGYGAVSAFVAAVSGLVTFIIRGAQAQGALPGNPPVYGTGVEQP